MKPKHLLALGVLLVGTTATASLTAAQKPAPQPTEQQKLKERVDALESQLKEANAKADRGAMEKDYIERTQKETKDYYDKVLSTQTWTLSIVGLVLTTVFGLTARFGFGIFDRRIQDSLRDASTQLETKFDQKLAEELQKLKDSNTAQLNQLADALTKRIDQAGADLKLKSDFQFQFLQGLASVANKEYQHALFSFREAVEHYKSGKPRNVVEEKAGEVSISNIFEALSMSEKNKRYRDDRARGELRSELFDGLEDELAHVGITKEWLAPLVRERKFGAPTAQPTAPTTVPALEQESATPAPDKSRPAKPQDPKSK